MPSGVYLHIPFCRSRCSYCDFATDIYRSTDAVDRYIAALCKEIGWYAAAGGNPSGSEGVTAPKADALASGHVSGTNSNNYISIDTIYFGGGTPSLLTPKQADQILAAIHKKFAVEPNAEITMEMNPATVTPDSLREYKRLGINRASFGVQTFNDRALKLLARGHDANDARETFRMLRDAGFDNISFDLIAGLPGQALKDWKRNLDEAIKLSPEHLSLYLLEIHEGTPLAEQVRSGRQPQPDEDLAAEMYRMMQDRLTAASFEQYEISNFAKPGFESRHNTKYWRLEPVYGFGVSAHSFDGRERYANERDTLRYIELIETGGSAEIMREITDLAAEYVILGLRMKGGISFTDYQDQFGIDLRSRHLTEIERIVEAGLLEMSARRISLTPKGMLFSNDVFTAFI